MHPITPGQSMAAHGIPFQGGGVHDGDNPIMTPPHEINWRATLGQDWNNLPQETRDQLQDAFRRELAMPHPRFHGFIQHPNLHHQALGVGSPGTARWIAGEARQWPDFATTHGLAIGVRR